MTADNDSVWFEKQNFKIGQRISFTSVNTRYTAKITEVDNSSGGVGARIYKVWHNGAWRKYPDAYNWRSKIWVWAFDFRRGKARRLR